MIELSPARFPDLASLTAGLTEVFRDACHSGTSLTVLDRQSAIHESTNPSEIVTCRVDGGSVHRLFCKYAGYFPNRSHGHRGGVSYEAAVYRHVLLPRAAAVPGFYGTHTEPTTGRIWLVLEALDEITRLSEAPHPDAILLAAQWIGAFHAATEISGSYSPPAFLTRYGAEYYLGWVRRTRRYAQHARRSDSWLDVLCDRFEPMAADLLAPPASVVHGEYFPHNVVWHDGAVRPVDWESAAVAAGVLDLASLTDGWPADVVALSERTYQQARWPLGAPAGFQGALTAARLYFQFRWLGDRPEWTASERQRRRFERLRLLGEEFGLL